MALHTQGKRYFFYERQYIRKICSLSYILSHRSTHNHLRITRILRSIGYLGYQHLQYPWFEFILQQSYAKDTLLPRLKGDCIKYWIESFQQDDRSKAEMLWAELDSDKEQPSCKHSDEKDGKTKNGTKPHTSYNKDVNGKPLVKENNNNSQDKERLPSTFDSTKIQSSKVSNDKTNATSEMAKENLQF